MAKRKPAKKKKARKTFQAYLGKGIEREALSKEDRESIEDLEEFMELAHKRWDQGDDAIKDQREREIEDLRFAAGDQWDADIKIMRAGLDAANGQPAVPARPCLTINKLLEPINQLIGDAQDSDLGFELVPADDFGELVGPIDDTEIKLREGLVRRIQREPEAQDAGFWAFDRGIKCGTAYWGVCTRYAEGRTNDQDIFVQRIYNQNSVILDPSHEQPDGSDAEWGFIASDMPWDEYKAEFPDVDDEENRVVGSDDDDFRTLGDEYPGWFTTDDDATRSCRVVDYYYTVRKPRKLATLKDGTSQWADKLADGVTPISVRNVVQKSIKWAKIDGTQILEETDWPSKYIPIIKYVGRELQPYDAEKRFEGLVRPAIDPSRAFNYMVSKWVEMIGLAPIPPLMMAGGQDEGYEKEYELMTTRTLGRLHYNQTDLFGRPAPPPFKTPSDIQIAPVAQSIGMFDEAIQTTTESHNPSHGQSDPALRSAKSIDTVVANDKHGSSNYLVNYGKSKKHEGRIINSLLYPIYGQRPGRITRIMDGDSNHEPVMIGKPYTMQGQGKMARPTEAASGTEGAKHYTLTKDAEFNCDVKITKNYETRRQEEAAMLGQLISSEPAQMMAVFGDLWFKSQDGPGHDEMAKRAKIMLAPQIQQALAAEAQGMDIPAPVQAHIQQLTQELQKQGDLLKKAQGLLQNETLKNQTTLEKTKMEVDRDIHLANVNNAAKIEVARISASKQAADPGAEADEELLATGIQHAQENFAADADHQRELEKMAVQHQLDTQASAQDHAQSMQEGQQAHAQQLEQGDQANTNAMQQTAQQAALQPEPAPAEGGTE